MGIRSVIRRRSLLSVALTALATSALVVPATAHGSTGQDTAPGSVGTRIVGGRFVTEQKPSIASLGGANHRCTSTIIAPRWVLTAAHCVGPGDRPFVRIGSLDRTQGGYTAWAVRVIQHPYYNWPSNDIALVQLDRDVRTTYSPLASAGDIAQNQAAEVYGWGSEQADWGGPLPTRLKYARGYMIGTRCTPANPAVLCFGAGNGTTAGGDSGGPLMVWSPQTGSWVQAGVSAVGPKPSGGWSGYTNIANYRTWIRQITGV
ncbi:trypsin-like serine protease [Streptomyces lunaelactis]|uniref:S1 family peptidase n=1 Tax=Streptomyces lunaelactis TaxID=1535768 RepID=UPI0015852326|nr:trypsin-like serine protease [Streptomyces lunaelactis]NUK52373.1 trypsin-like serine protease [Streptomyces lunaelactis]NUK65640.1 trypsin-like serine protease [Streptomyces lunaelactis]